MSRQKRQDNFHLQGQLSVLAPILKSVPPSFTTAACKDTGHSGKNAGDRLQYSTHVALNEVTKVLVHGCTV